VLLIFCFSTCIAFSGREKMVRYEGGQVRRKFADPYADQDEKTKTKMGKKSGKEKRERKVGKWERKVGKKSGKEKREREMGNGKEKSERR
jgi:hypothetical protein